MTKPGKWSLTSRNFFDNIRVSKNGCWEWIGARKHYAHTKSLGYGRYGQEDAHRMMFTFMHGDPGDAHVCHTCDNPPCVNPEHLYAGTHAKNMRDAVLRGRLYRFEVKCGEAHPCSKLTADTVKRIRRMRGLLSQREIAAILGVSAAVIAQIQTRRTWKHVEET